MKPILAMAAALAALGFPAEAQSGAMAAGRELSARGDYGKAAAHFQVGCNADRDAEACYWAGLTYERLADTKVPFGCRIDAKAHEYFVKATKLAPGRPAYREALFDFLLDTTDCSRTALREAAGVLAMSESDSAYPDMLDRLKEERHWNRSVDERVGRVFLMLPRAAYRMAAAPAPAVKKGAAVRAAALETTGDLRLSERP